MTVTFGIVALLIIGLVALSGWLKGAVMMIWSVVSIVVAFIGTRFIMTLLPNEKLGAYAFPVAFIIMVVVLIAIGAALQLVDKIPVIGSVDKILGLLAGLIMGYAIVMILIYVIENLTGVPQIAEFYEANIKDDNILNVLRSINVIDLYEKAQKGISDISAQVTK